METETVNKELWESNDYIGKVNEFDSNTDKWFGGLITTTGTDYIKPCLVLGETKEQVQERTELIVTAVNACKEINPDNPLNVAKLLPKIFEILHNCRVTLKYSKTIQLPNSGRSKGHF